MEPVVIVDLDKTPEWIRRSRINRGLDPDTGRRPGAQRSLIADLLPGLLFLAVGLAALALVVYVGVWAIVS